jgi:hypothetical protein
MIKIIARIGMMMTIATIAPGDPVVCAASFIPAP